MSVRARKGKLLDILRLGAREQVKPLFLVAGTEEGRIASGLVSQNRICGSGHGLWNTPVNLASVGGLCNSRAL